MFAYYSNKNDYNSIDLNSEPFKRYMQYRSAHFWAKGRDLTLRPMKNT